MWKMKLDLGSLIKAVESLETSHAYDEDKAGSVFAAAVAFVGDARGLLELLRERNGD
jgi:hypothetical protein